jgi:hypothetical protein
MLLIALEYGDAELGLQLLNARTERRLGDMAGGCSLAEMAKLRNGTEIP